MIDPLHNAAQPARFRVLIPQLPPAELERWRADDAREAPLASSTCASPGNTQYCRIDGSVSHAAARVRRGATRELPRDRALVMVCHHGRRSQHAAMLLEGAGFTQVHNLRGRASTRGRTTSTRR